MEIELNEKPKKGAVMIEGFPGFGLVSTIATEFLIDHLGAKQIGKMRSNKITPIIALHKGTVIEPLGIFYSAKANIVIVRSISPIKDMEWEATDALIKLAKDIQAKEIISIEGVGSDGKLPEPEAFYYSNDASKEKKFKSLGLKKLDEGVILGVTAALLAIKPETTCIFSEAYSNMPDSRAAARVIEVIDGYLGLNVDYKPLLKKAASFEGKIKNILVKGVEATAQQKEKHESYFG